MTKIYAISPLFSEDMRQMEERQREFLLTDASGWDFDDEGGDDRPYEVVNGVAVYNIRGKMLSEGNFFTKVFGIASYDDIGNTMSAMAQDDEVEKVLISMSTPGGNVSGLSDLSDTWKKLNAEKPITVHTPGTLASAGMWLSSNSSKIYASETSEVGSIGVILQHVSYEKNLDKQGVKVTEIKSAPKKYIGSAAKDLSAEDLAHLQEKVDESAEIFKKQMYSTRPGISSSAFTGEVFSASESLQKGLIDGIATFSDVFVNMLAGDAGSTSNSSYMEDYRMKKKVTASMYEAALASGADPDSLEVVSQEEFDALEEETLKTFATQEMVDAAVEAGESAEDYEVITQEEFDALESDASDDLDTTDYEDQVNVLSDELAVANDSVETLTAEVASLTEALEASASDPLRKIAEDRISVMRIALGMQSVDMAEFPVNSVLAEYEALDKQFKAAYKSGGHKVVTKDADDDADTKKAAVTNIDNARFRAVGIK